MENNVYVPTKNGIGALTTQQVGGDVDVKGLADIDYFRHRLFGSLRVPQQYLLMTMLDLAAEHPYLLFQVDMLRW